MASLGALAPSPAASRRAPSSAPRRSSRPGRGNRRAVVAGADHLLGDAADGADLPRVVDGPGAGDELAAGQRPRRQLVHDAEREHQAGAGAADVLQRDLHLERVGRLVRGDDADHRAAVVRGGRRGHRRGHVAAVPAYDDRDRVARLVRGHRGAQRRPAGRRLPVDRDELVALAQLARRRRARPAVLDDDGGLARGCRATAARPWWRSPASRSSRRCSPARPPRRTRPWGTPSSSGTTAIELLSQPCRAVNRSRRCRGPPSTDTVTRSRWPWSG